ncbi:hypothetical protein [Streptomyces sp. MN6]
MSTRDVVSGQTPDDPDTSVSTRHGVTTRVTLDPDGSFVVAQTVDVTPTRSEANSL